MEDTTLKKEVRKEGRKIVCMTKQNETACSLNHNTPNSVLKNLWYLSLPTYLISSGYIL